MTAGLVVAAKLGHAEAQRGAERVHVGKDAVDEQIIGEPDERDRRRRALAAPSSSSTEL